MSEITAPQGHYVALEPMLFGEGWLEVGDTIPFEEGRNYESMVRFKQAVFNPTPAGETRLEARLKTENAEHLERISDLEAQTELLLDSNHRLQARLDEAGIGELRGDPVGEVDTDALPQDFPAFYVLRKADLGTFSGLKGQTLEELIAIKGIGEASAKKILELVTAHFAT